MRECEAWNGSLYNYVYCPCVCLCNVYMISRRMTSLKWSSKNESLKWEREDFKMNIFLRMNSKMNFEVKLEIACYI